MEQLLGHALPQDSEGSFGDDFSNGASDCLGYVISRGAGLGLCALQQVGKQVSLGHAENALIAQQGTGETVDHLSCCHRTPPGRKDTDPRTGQSGKRRGLHASKEKCEREVLIQSRRRKS